MENKPAPEPKPEEILKKAGYDEDAIFISYQTLVKYMQIYADLYHKEKLRGELKAFNNFVLKLEEEGKIPLIDTCIEDFIKTIE